MVRCVHIIITAAAIRRVRVTETMDPSEFTVVLPSNASTTLFPENTLTHYRTRLAHHLNLHSNAWIVGLREITFPESWHNLHNGWVLVRHENLDKTVKFELKKGYYAVPQRLIDEIHQILMNAQIEKEVHFYYDEITNRVRLKIHSNQLKIGLSPQIRSMLGFSKAETFFEDGMHVSDSPVDMMEGFSSLYIYSNIAQNRMVGDSLVPLLRHVPFEYNKRRQQQWIQFQNVEYIPVANGNTDLIEIDIRRDDGTRVSFESGKVVVTLHFMVKR